MFKNYLNREEFKEFERSTFFRTKNNFNLILDNLSHKLNESEINYFYSFLLPHLIELDYLNFVSSKVPFKTFDLKYSLKNEVKKTIKNSLMILNRNLLKNKIQINSNREIMDNFIRSYNIDKSLIVSLDYFYRHKEYLDKFSSKNKIVEIKKDNLNFLEKKLIKTKKYFNISNFPNKNQYEKNLVDAIDFFLNFRNDIYFICKALIISTHSWVGSNLSRLIISYTFAKTNIPIVALQTGLAHQHSLCMSQVIWERFISNKYATWSDSKLNTDQFVGSMYSWKSLYKNNNSNETLILPQIPRSNLPRCFASYWGLTYADFLDDQKKLIDEIDKILCKSKAPLFRIKKTDLRLYQKLIFKYFKKVAVDAGDINNAENFQCTKKSYIFYLSTAIPQAVNAGSETYGIFSNKETFLNDEFSNLIPNKYPFQCEHLSRTLSKVESIEQYILRLSDLIKTLCD